MPKTLHRLIFVHGPWQLIMANAALRQSADGGGGPDESSDTLIFFPLPDGPLPEPISRVMKQIAERVWPWRRVVMLDDTIMGGLDNTEESVAALRERLGLEHVDEIWVDCLFGSLEKIAAETYPKAGLVLYEDGLHSYLPVEDHYLSMGRWASEPRAAYRAVRHRVRELRNPSNLAVAPMLTRHLARVKASYLWINGMVAAPDYQKRLPGVRLETRHVRGIIDDIAPLVAGVVDPVEEDGRRRAIVLGQCFSNYDDFPRELELSWYVDLLDRLRRMGYDVIWKEHPRTRQPFLPELAKLVEGVDSSPDIGPWPIELFVERLRLSACAALTSTSLYSIPLLFGLPSYSTAGRYVSMLRFPNDLLTRLVAGSIKNMDEDDLPIAGSSEENPSGSAAPVLQGSVDDSGFGE